MAKIKSAYSPSFSPDGKRIAFISDLNGVPQVWTIPTSGGYPELLTNLDDPVMRVLWSPDGQWIGFSVAPGGGMNQQIHVIRPDGTGQRRLTDGGKENNYFNDWAHDGSAISYTSNRRNPASSDSYLVKIESGEQVIIAENRGTGAVNDLRKDGGAAIVSRIPQRGDNDLFFVRLSDKKEHKLTPHDGPGSFYSGAFSPDGKVVYLASNKDRDLVAFAKVTLGKDDTPGPIEKLAARDDAELDALHVNEAGTLIALSWNVGGKSELAFYDVKTSKVTPGPTLPTELASGLRFSKDGKSLAMVLSGATSPADIWVLDVASKKLTQITKSPRAGVNVSSFVRPEKVTYKAHDGLELSGWLYRSKLAAGPGPIVLSFHGGPEGQERPSFNSTYQALLARGISVLAPNVRGSGGFGKKFVNLDNGALRENAVKDIDATVKFAVSSGVADPKRMGIMGGSYGGYMTMAGLTEYPDVFAAGANSFGVVNFATFFKHSEPWMAAISKIEYGDPDKEAAMLEKLSPIHRIDRVKAPTLVLHGANDTNVPVIEATQVVESLKKRGIPVDYVLFPDEGHGFRKTPNKVRAAVATVTFFEKYLAGK